MQKKPLNIKKFNHRPLNNLWLKKEVSKEMKKKKTPNQTKTSKYREQSNSYQREGDRSAQEEEKWVKNEYKMSTKCQLYGDGWGFFSGSVVEKEKNHLPDRRQRRIGFDPWVGKISWSRAW